MRMLKDAEPGDDAIPGVGPALATALVASIADPKAFRSGRDFSARIRFERWWHLPHRGGPRAYQ